jgi:hypothetical protein
MMSQKDAVYAATTSLLREKNIAVVNGELFKSTSMTRSEFKDFTRVVALIIAECFKQKKIYLNKDFSNEEIDRYSHSVVSNWFLKDKRLNNRVNDKKKSNRKEKISQVSMREVKKLLVEVNGTKYEKQVVEAYAKIILGK